MERTFEKETAFSTSTIVIDFDRLTASGILKKDGDIFPEEIGFGCLELAKDYVYTLIIEEGYKERK